MNAHVGLVFSPDGTTLYASGGVDDVVYAYAKGASSWSLAAQIPLGHANTGVGVSVRPNAAGLGISADGRTLVVAKNYNDSISVIDSSNRRRSSARRFRAAAISKRSPSGWRRTTSPRQTTSATST